MKVSLVTVTPDEKLYLYCARVSNPQNQNNDSFEGLLLLYQTPTLEHL